MNKEKIINELLKISTPTGITPYGDYTLDDYTCNKILDYINELEKENTNLKQALNDIREYVNNHKRNLIHPLTGEEYEMLDDENILNILQIIDKVRGNEK